MDLISVLGFSNCYYREALENPQIFELPNGLAIRIPTPPLMLATKIARHDRLHRRILTIGAGLD